MKSLKRYDAIFFDWDGTAVTSRRASPDPVIGPMKALLQKGMPLIIISGTTYDKIAEGEIERYFSPAELQNLFLGLGRGALNYRFDAEGHPQLWHTCVPNKAGMLKIHEVCFDIHCALLSRYGIETDIVFSRPNYCKIDLAVENDRGEALYLQGGEIAALHALLERHGFDGGVAGLTRLATALAARRGLALSTTCDAKYLEVGETDKRDNVDVILSLLRRERGIVPQGCCFWGDEYVGLDTGLFGSDSCMITDLSRPGDFFDVSDTPGERPAAVRLLGGGVDTFLAFLKEQAGRQA